MTNGFVAGDRAPCPSPQPCRDATCRRCGAATCTRSWPPDVRPADPELRHNMLGMTEAGSVILLSGDETDQPEHRRGSFGKPAPGFETKVVDPDTGKPVDVGDVGELCIRGPYRDAALLQAQPRGVLRRRRLVPHRRSRPHRRGRLLLLRRQARLDDQDRRRQCLSRRSGEGHRQGHRRHRRARGRYSPTPNAASWSPRSSSSTTATSSTRSALSRRDSSRSCRRTRSRRDSSRCLPRYRCCPAARSTCSELDDGVRCVSTLDHRCTGATARRRARRKAGGDRPGRPNHLRANSMRRPATWPRPSSTPACARAPASG